MSDARMQSAADGLDTILDQFTQWVKRLNQQTRHMHNEHDLQQLEEQLRDEGQAMLGRLLQAMLQQAVDAQQEPARTCPACDQRRRHQGVRRRTLRSSLGRVEVSGIYWRCPTCGLCGHTADALMPESFSGLLQQLTGLLGASLASFHKAEVVARRVLNVDLDDETIRRHCLSAGWQASRDMDQPPIPVKTGDTLLGSCDGTMVRTRQTGWREVKGFRFEHDNGCFGGASLESAETFLPRLKRAADRLEQEHAGRCVFLSDLAEWIRLGVSRELPDWQHLADFWHAAEHIHAAGKVIYGEHDRRSAKWGRYWSRRLKWYGAASVADRMRRTVLCYRELDKQSELLKLVRFLDKHAARMDYPSYVAAGLPIGSGPMESFCKQLGARLKGPGMRWSVSNVTPMAMLVSRWSLEPERFAGLAVRRCAA